MNKYLVSALAGFTLFAAGGLSSAHAGGVSVGIAIGVPAPVIVAPAPVYYEPAYYPPPVYYAPPRVVYVSCNPDALAHELPAIGAAGYALTRAHLVDMFPHTEHIEAVVQFDRVRA